MWHFQEKSQCQGLRQDDVSVGSWCHTQPLRIVCLRVGVGGFSCENRTHLQRSLPPPTPREPKGEMPGGETPCDDISSKRYPELASGVVGSDQPFWSEINRTERISQLQSLQSSFKQPFHFPETYAHGNELPRLPPVQLHNQDSTPAFCFHVLF